MWPVCAQQITGLTTLSSLQCLKSHTLPGPVLLGVRCDPLRVFDCSDDDEYQSVLETSLRGRCASQHDGQHAEIRSLNYASFFVVRRGRAWLMVKGLAAATQSRLM